MKIAVILDPSAGLTDATFRRASAAMAVYLTRDVAPAYMLPAPSLVIVSDTNHPDVDAWIKIVGRIEDAPSALGYHTVDDDGGIDGYVSTDGLAFDGFCEVYGHELAELLVDPNVNETRVAANGDRYPLEVCDAVQGQRYLLALNDGKPPVALPNFVLPGYWQADAHPGLVAFDHMGNLSGPFTLAPEGYSAITKPDGTQVQIGLASRRRAHAMSRPERRKRTPQRANVEGVDSVVIVECSHR